MTRREWVRARVLETIDDPDGVWQETIYRIVVSYTPPDSEHADWWSGLPAHRRVNLVRGIVDDMITEHSVEQVPGTRQATGRHKLRLVGTLDRVARSLN